METAVVGREVTCGVLGEEALAPILVVSKGNYFDYHNKYAPDGAQEICPAPIAPEETRQSARTRPSAPTMRSGSRATAAPTSSFRMTAPCISLKSTPRRA